MRSRTPNQLLDVRLHTMAMPGLSCVRTELFYLLILPPLAHHPEPRRPVKFEGSAATRGTQQAQALATSARGHQSEAKAKPQTAQSIRRFDDLAILYDSTRNYLWRSALDFIAEVISEISSLLTIDLQEENEREFWT